MIDVTGATRDNAIEKKGKSLAEWVAGNPIEGKSLHGVLLAPRGRGLLNFGGQSEFDGFPPRI